ncbi:MAG TPA: HAD-IA family hydrolase [Candidatus Saccharimonadales bacterium]
MALRAVIFDVDGVLVDSHEANDIFYERLLVAAGYPKPTREELHGCFHLTMRDVITKLTGADGDEVERIWQLGQSGELYPKEALQFPPSLLKVLRELRKHYRLAIVTGRIRTGVQIIFSRQPIGGLFEVVVTAQDYENPKPHPEPLLLALKLLQLKPREAVYIGDSHTDIEAAREAGMPSIHLAPRKHEDANVGITDFAQIPGAVRKVEHGLGKT